MLMLPPAKEQPAFVVCSFPLNAPPKMDTSLMPVLIHTIILLILVVLKLFVQFQSSLLSPAVICVYQQLSHQILNTPCHLPTLKRSVNGEKTPLGRKWLDLHNLVFYVQSIHFSLILVLLSCQTPFQGRMHPTFIFPILVPNS